MPDVIEIVFQFLDRVLFALAVGIVYLRPTSDPRLYQVPKMVKRNFLLITLRAFDPFRARPDQAHVAFEHIPELRQFIESKFAQPSPDARDARIAFARINIRLLFLLVVTS